MFFFRRRKATQHPSPKEQKDKVQESKIPADISLVEQKIKQELQNSSDIVIKRIDDPHQPMALFYVGTLTDLLVIQQVILPRLYEYRGKQLTAEIWKELLPIGEINLSSDLTQVTSLMLRGWTYLHIQGSTKGLLLNAIGIKNRSLTTPENESNVFGPQVGFTESLESNISLIRRYISNPKLCNESLMVGKITRTRMSLLYIEGIAPEQNINTLRQRIQNLEVDQVMDSSIIAQLIEDNSKSAFPQMLLTERPDRVSSSLLEGKLALIVAGSPYAIVCPSTFVEFFQSMEDYYIRWNMATFLRLLRVIAIFMSIFFTPVYVAALTFHYEIIPSALLVPLAQSRSKVPFPPLFEALLLEMILDLLREAGARLPTKVGQTMGIVGGIVIGQAAVQAGFTSNILIIIVALGALASFTTPSYLMGSTIRMIRFPIILLAGIWGGLGIMFGFCFLLIHLIRQTSLGSPYFEPFYPLRIGDLKDSFIRMPLEFFSRRPQYTRAEDKGRFDKKGAKEKKDIDE